MSRPATTGERPETEPRDQRVVRFRGYEFDLEGLVLTRDGERVPLQPQPSRVLAELVRGRGSVVTREQLRDRIWGERFVEFDQGLNFSIRQIRSTLGDEAETPTFIETVPRRGYRFLPAVEVVEAERTAPQRSRARLLGWTAATGLLLALLGWMVWPSAPPAVLDPPIGPDEVAARTLPESTQALFLAALERLRARTAEGYRRAASDFDVVLGRHPDFVPARIGRAEAWLWEGRTDDARRELDAILVDRPDESRAHTLRGALALFRDWDLARARRHLLRGRELAPESSMANQYAAYYSLIVGDSASARQSIQRALRLDPLSATLQGDAGLIFYWLGDYARGAELCRRSLALLPPEPSGIECLLWNEAAAERREGVVEAARGLARLDSAPGEIQTPLARGDSGLAAFLDWEIRRRSALPDRGSGTALTIARLEMLRDHLDGAKAALIAGVARHSNSLVFLGVDPLLAPVRRDPVVQRLVDSITAGRPSSPER